MKFINISLLLLLLLMFAPRAYSQTRDLSAEDSARYKTAHSDILDQLNRIYFKNGLGSYGADCDLTTFKIDMIYKIYWPSGYTRVIGIQLDENGYYTAHLGCGYNNTDNVYVILYNFRERKIVSVHKK